MSEQAAMPDAETVRGWWADLCNGVRTREEVHALAAQWLEGEELVDDPLADYGLADLHGADLRQSDGTWLHPMQDLADRYEKFAAAVRFRAEDPEGYRAAEDERRHQRRLELEAERAAGLRPPRRTKPLS
ncbi:hypothetical protein LWF15_02135 [Kineosporia rhizophila]|uniref:hypothetical protein n=1 Tax=Kineosporia rhizophila TaxID=84633 RepID=UPI001E3F7C6F|nr:hypothetical protein [Kineosporia rhizophila]MCE0534298.1 hypothetical protein [Kineosporia rhizophila]